MWLLSPNSSGLDGVSGMSLGSDLSLLGYMQVK